MAKQYNRFLMLGWNYVNEYMEISISDHQGDLFFQRKCTICDVREGRMNKDNTENKDKGSQA